MYKRFLIVLTIVMISSLFSGCGKSSATISSTDDDGLDEHKGGYHTLNLMMVSPNTPYISFDRSSLDHQLSVKRFNGSAMVDVGTNPISTKRAVYSKLARHTDGTIFLAFSDENEAYKATVMQYDGSNWSVKGESGFTNTISSYLSIDVDSSGVPYLAFVERLDTVDEGGRLAVRRWNGSAWEAVGPSYLTADKAYFVSLKIDPITDQPIVVFVDRLIGNRAIAIRFNGSAWEYLGPPGFTASNSFYTNLQISPTGSVFVDYADSAQGYRATVKRFDGSDWQLVGSSGFSPGMAYYNSLAISPTGNLAIAFVDSENNSRVSAMTYEEGNWNILGLAGFSFEDASWTSLAYDSGGIPYLACKIGEDSLPYLYRYVAGNWVQIASGF